MKRWLAMLPFCVEPRNLTLRPLVYQEVKHAEASSVVHIAAIRERTWTVCHAERVRAGKIGWQ